MTVGQEQLLALARLAIHPDSELPNALTDSSIDWKEVLEEAEKQSLAGVAFAGFKHWLASGASKQGDSPIDKRLYTKWFALAESIREDNLRLNRRTAQVCHNFAKDGLRTSVMKGQGNALLYGQELMLMRTSGDIDVWVEGGFQKVYDYVMRVSPTTKVDQMEIKFNAFSDTEVEIHYRPIILRHLLRNRRLQQFIGKQADKCFANRVQLLTTNREGEEAWKDAVITTIPFNIVHQLAHILLHLFSEGVGLRQVMDYYFQLVHAKDALEAKEKEEVVKVVKDLDLERLARALTWILTEYFGLEKDCRLWSANKEDGEFLLEEIMRTGNFGHTDERRPEGLKVGGLEFFLYVQKRNLALSRFDRTNWFWGSLWRIYYYFWRRIHGFTRI